MFQLIATIVIGLLGLSLPVGLLIQSYQDKLPE